MLSDTRATLQCFVLRDEVDELDNRYSGFWCSLVRWLWIVKTPLKMLRNQKIKPDPNVFYDGQSFWRQCVNVIDTTWSRIIFFNVQTFRTCAMTLSPKFSHVKNKHDLTIKRQSRLHKKIMTRDNFLRFHLRSKHLDRKGWRIHKKLCIRKFVRKDFNFIIL